MNLVFFSNNKNRFQESIPWLTASASSGVQVYVYTTYDCPKDIFYKLRGELYDGQTLSKSFNHVAGILEEKNINEVLFVRDRVIPSSNWVESIQNINDKLDCLDILVGRFYKKTRADRNFVSNDFVGGKFVDIMPSIIAKDVIDFAPAHNLHAIKVSRVPLVCALFKNRGIVNLKAALVESNNFIELGRRIFSEDKKKLFSYYSPVLEAFDTKFMIS